MQTFLEFVCTKLIGAPTDRRGNGESFFTCPFCASERFHTLPVKQNCKESFKCWACTAWGDALDVLKEVFPDEGYCDRLDRLDALKREFVQAGGKVVPEPTGDSGSTDGVRGTMLLWRLLNRKAIDHNDLLEVVGELNHRLNLRREWLLLGRRRLHTMKNKMKR